MQVGILCLQLAPYGVVGCWMRAHHVSLQQRAIVDMTDPLRLTCLTSEPQMTASRDFSSVGWEENGARVLFTLADVCGRLQNTSMQMNWDCGVESGQHPCSSNGCTRAWRVAMCVTFTLIWLPPRQLDTFFSIKSWDRVLPGSECGKLAELVLSHLAPCPSPESQLWNFRMPIVFCINFAEQKSIHQNIEEVRPLRSARKKRHGASQSRRVVDTCTWFVGDIRLGVLRARNMSETV